MTPPETGAVLSPMPGLRQVLAPNPGPMTHWGTNSFIIGEDQVAVIDPGPDDARHLDALLRAIQGATVTHILITHPHKDHSPLARRFARMTGAPVLGFGPPEAGRSAIMASLANTSMASGGEGVDTAFRPDQAMSDGDQVDGDGWTLRALHAPGHFAGHLAFEFQDILISGDHVMDWSSSLVSPPDGDLRSFMDTSERLRDHGSRRLLPAHGGAIADPADRLNWLIEHRLSRETSIRGALTARPGPWPRSQPGSIPTSQTKCCPRPNAMSWHIFLISRKEILPRPRRCRV